MTDVGTMEAKANSLKSQKRFLCSLRLVKLKETFTFFLSRYNLIEKLLMDQDHYLDQRNCQNETKRLTEVQKHEIWLHFLDNFYCFIVNCQVRLFNATKRECTLEPVNGSIVRKKSSTKHAIHCVVGGKMMKPIPGVAHIYLVKKI